MNVLLVDDDSTFRFIFRKQVEKQNGLEIMHESEHGLAALEYLKSAISESKELPDVIILDINMPIMDGWMFLDDYSKWSKEAGIDIPVCMLSSTINQMDFDKSKTYSSVIDFFSKPFSSEHINRLLSLEV